MDRKDNFVVGLFVVLAVAILLYGVYFLKETSPGRKMDKYSVLFDQVSTLQNGDPVKVNGVKMGKVADLKLIDQHVHVTVEVERGIRLPKDSEVRIQNIGLMGERQIGILLGHSSDYFVPGAELQGVLDAGIAEALGIAGEVFVQSEIMVKTLRSVMDSTVGKKEFVSTFNQLLDDTKALSNRLNDLVKKVDPQIRHSIANLENASLQMNSLIKEEQKPLHNIIKNGEDISERLKVVAAKADQIAENMNHMLEKAQSGHSTLGAMLNDTTLYTELRSTAQSADSLFRQIKKQGLDVNIDLF